MAAETTSTPFIINPLANVVFSGAGSWANGVVSDFGNLIVNSTTYAHLLARHGAGIVGGSTLTAGANGEVLYDSTVNVAGFVGVIAATKNRGHNGFEHHGGQFYNISVGTGGKFDFYGNNYLLRYIPHLVGGYANSYPANGSSSLLTLNVRGPQAPGAVPPPWHQASSRFRCSIRVPEP